MYVLLHKNVSLDIYKHVEIKLSTNDSLIASGLDPITAIYGVRVKCN